MIEKKEIIAMAARLAVNPDILEKDYVLSWMLWGINHHDHMKDTWLFKGGTSLHKCFFETYRFSEDLDFTLTDPLQLSAPYLKENFSVICEKIYEETGIVFYKELFSFKTRPNIKGNVSVEGKIYYNGPLERRKAKIQQVAVIKLDLTSDELVVLKPTRKKVYHPYSDEPKDGIFATCYALEEVVAEKIRALGERLRPRDVYDVVNFYKNRDVIAHVNLVNSVLAKKCAYKKIGVPTLESIKKHEKLEELASEWKNMLAHQLPSLPPLELFLDDIEPFFKWLNDSENNVT